MKIWISQIGSMNSNFSQQSIAAIRADSYILSIISLPIFSHRLDRLLIRLRIFATLLVRRLSFGLISNFVFLYCISTGRTQHQMPNPRQCSALAPIVNWHKEQLQVLFRSLMRYAFIAVTPSFCNRR